MKQTRQAELLVAQALLAALKREGNDPQAMAFWEEAVTECEAEMERQSGWRIANHLLARGFLLDDFHLPRPIPEFRCGAVILRLCACERSFIARGMEVVTPDQPLSLEAVQQILRLLGSHHSCTRTKRTGGGLTPPALPLC